MLWIDHKEAALQLAMPSWLISYIRSGRGHRSQLQDGDLTEQRFHNAMISKHACQGWDP
jgi:hypothetical protein